MKAQNTRYYNIKMDNIKHRVKDLKIDTFRENLLKCTRTHFKKIHRSFI